MVSAGAPDPRPGERPAERAQRNFSEIVQELRVAGLGVQVLFGFLLALPFTAPHFASLSAAQKALYTTDVMLAAAATIALGAPIAYHRWNFRRGEKERLVAFSNRLVLVGLALVALAIPCSVGLVVSDVTPGVLPALLSALIFGAFAVFWLAIPLVVRIRDERAPDEERAAPGGAPLPAP